MQIEIKLDESCKEPKIIIHTDKMTEEVSQIVKLLSEEKPEVFAAIHENGEIILLEQTEIIRIYAENDRVYAKTKDGSYRLKARLYELEERLNKKMFIRISNSEIINLKEVKKFDLSFSGTICVSMSDKTATRSEQQRMFQGVTSEKSNRYWDYRNGGVCEKYIFHTQEWRLS